MSSTGHGQLPVGHRSTGHRAARTGLRRRYPAGARTPPDGRRWSEFISSAAVILAGVLVVIGFGFVASRAVRSDTEAPNISVPQGPALGQITLPPISPSQGPIPLDSPSPSSPPSPSSSPSPSSPSPATSATTTKTATSAPPPPDPGAISLAKGDVPGTVNLTAEGATDWVHWGEESTFSLERDKDGGFAILEGAPTAPRFRHALSTQRFSWTGGDPVDHSDGTPTGIRTCGANNGFTLSVPAGTKTRTLKLYLGVIAGRGRLSAKLSAGTAGTSTTIEQKDGAFRTTVVTLRYRAPKTAKLNLKWITEAAFGSGCGGVALQAATLH